MQYYEQTRNLIARAKEFHGHLHYLQSQLQDQSKKEKLNKLLGYLDFHGRELDQTLAQLPQETTNKILDIWFKYIPEGNACKCFDLIHVQPQMTIEEITEIVMEIDGCLMELYEEISRVWDTQDGRDLCGTMFKNIKNEKNKISRQSLLFEY
jgi:hypothetical protein